MPSITKQRQGKYTYLYESTSYRDEQGRPRNHKVKIGKLAPGTGKPVYTEEYLDRMRQAGTPVHISIFDAADGLEERIQEALDSARDYGLFCFLKLLAEKTGILQILRETIPAYWNELCMLSFYLLASDKPLMYMDMWMNESEHLPTGKMDSRRISELLSAFGQKERNDFYRAWCTANISGEYLAPDITSISSYSKLIPDCGWGYNRDGEALRQVNMCLLFGGNTQLPLYQTLYSGSLADASTFQTTIAEMKAVSGEKPLVLVMDKGFYSEKNVKTLIKEEHRFLVSVPFTALYANKLIDEVRKRIDCVANSIKTSASPVRGVSRTVRMAGSQLTAHILYNPERELCERNALYAHTFSLKEKLETGEKLSGFQEDIKKYLAVCDHGAGVSVTIRQDVLDKELSTSGWVVIIGNEKMNAQEAHDIYRKKDVAEKAFMKYKNSLGMGRLRVHDAERMRNKSLVSFIALVLISAIHKVMKEKDLYKTMTADKLLMTLSKLKLTVIDGHRILRPVTKEQRKIFSAFALPPPTVG
jgi:transposase